MAASSLRVERPAAPLRGPREKTPAGYHSPVNARSVANVLWRRKFVSLIIAGLVMAGGLGFLYSQPKVWESTSSIAVLPPPQSPSSIQDYANLLPNLIPTYIQLVNSQSFLDGVARSLSFPTTGRELTKHVHGESVTNAGIIKVVADMPTPSQAQEVARATTNSLLNQLSNNGVVKLQVFDSPRYPDSPVAPRPKLVLGATIVLAIILGLAGGLVWERLFGRVFSSAELADASGIPVIGIMPEERRLRLANGVVIGAEGMERMEEAIRSLRTNFVFATSGGKLRSVAITSLGPEEGKTTIAANLAVVVAELGLQVVLVDGDIHRPRIHRIFALPNDRGLTSTVLSGARPASLLQQVPNIAGLQVVTSGPPLRDRTDEVTLYLQHLSAFVGLGDIVIVDSPPLRAGADIRLLATATQGVLLAVRSGSVTPRHLRAALDSLSALDTRVIGTVLTRSKDPAEMGDAVSYYTGYRRPSTARGSAV